MPANPANLDGSALTRAGGRRITMPRPWPGPGWRPNAGDPDVGPLMANRPPRLVYHPGYNITFFGLERLHPFDGRKYARAYALLCRQFGQRALAAMTLGPRRPIGRDALLGVHSADYLDQLRDARFVAGVLELPLFAKAPGWLADWRVLRPMRWATAGTVLAAEHAMGAGEKSDGVGSALRTVGRGETAPAEAMVRSADPTSLPMLVDRSKSTGSGVPQPMPPEATGPAQLPDDAGRGTVVMNLGGGYHHASPTDGHGFSAYADVGLAVAALRRPGPRGEPPRLAADDTVAYVDLDAHQGNGVCRTFEADRRVLIFDAYNRHIFPLDVRAQRRIDHDRPLDDGCSEAKYLRAVTTELPRFLDSVARADPITGRRRCRLAIYNAGTDPYDGDRLGRMGLSADGIFERDKFAIDQLAGRGLPTVVLTSGGYSAESYRMVARTAAYVLGGEIGE